MKSFKEHITEAYRETLTESNELKISSAPKELQDTLKFLKGRVAYANGKFLAADSAAQFALHLHCICIAKVS